MKMPTVYNPQQLKEWPVNTQTKEGHWIPSRPMNYSKGLFKRLLLTFKVFTGEFDVLDWKN
jgi:hypothetical protein